jgi:galactokinase
MSEERPARWRAPGRVNLIGEHTDYNQGFALPFAIPHGVSATVTPRADDRLVITSAQEPDPARVALATLEPGAVEGWAAYPAGVVWALLRHGLTVKPGFDIGIDGDVPLGAGLSSSAAVVCATAAALDDVLGAGLPTAELIRLARQAENEFVGAPTGGMDQMASMLCTAGHALFIDARDMSTRQVPFDLAPAGLAILVTDTRVRHAHAEGGYRQRRAACTRAAELLGVPALRDIDIADLPAALDRLPDEDTRGVTRHVVTEDDRVLRTVALLDAGEIAATGPLLDAAHDSMRDDFKASAPEVDVAVEAARRAGALGARITGGGFGGCTIALARTGDLDGIKAAIAADFAAHRYEPPRFWVTTPSPGTHRLG